MNTQILGEIKGSFAFITLNRPEALNALSIEMVRGISALLKEWAENDAVKAVCFKGAGERAFCAGGDIKSVYNKGLEYRAGKTGVDYPVQILREEYNMNRLMFHYKKPLIALMHGITMGGGWGIAGNCDYRVITPDALFAMPETAIGFFTDVGSVYHLQSCPHHIGRYLVLTGARIGAADMMFAGIATHMAESDSEEEILKLLSPRKQGYVETFKPEDSRLRGKSSMGELEHNANAIERHFAFNDPEVIVESLKAEEGQWASDSLKTLQSRCPLSVKVCARHYARAASMDFDAVMETDFILGQRFMDCPDFYEGVRAALIERDNAPQWSHESFRSVPESDVDACFRPTGYALE